jgi:hypothetical protein
LGAIVVTPQFDDVRPFLNGRAGVKLCCGYWSNRGESDRYGVIDPDGRYVHSPDLAWIGVQGFLGELATVRTRDGAYAFLDREGELLLTARFEQLGEVGFTEGLAAAATGGKWGFIDETAGWVINPQFEGASMFREGLAAVKVAGLYGYVDRNGRFALNPRYRSADPFRDGLAVVNTGAAGGETEVGVINKEGRFVIPAEYSLIWGYTESMTAVASREGWGFVDRAGSVVIPRQFDVAWPFQGGLAQVRVRDQVLYIDSEGNYVGPSYDPVVVSKGACPFEGCQLGAWVAREAFVAYAAIDGNALAERFETGTRVTALNAEVHARPQRAVVTGTYRTDVAKGIGVGHVVYPLHPIGEGAITVWHDGAIKETSLDLTYDYTSEGAKLDWTWWVQVRLSDGRTIWLKDPQGFDGMDRYS